METVIETSMWVDFFRAKTPHPVKAQIKSWMLRPDLALCEPVLCELLRSASAAQRPVIQRHFATIPVLPTPATLWPDATQLGQRCCDAGIIVGALDLLITTVCLHHGAELITFDKLFANLARVCRLRARVLERAV